MTLICYPVFCIFFDFGKKNAIYLNCFLPLQKIAASMKEYSDSEIIDCLRNRQSYVVGYLSDRYLPMIRLMVTRLGGSPEDAKDIFQEGLMIILEKIDIREFALTCKFKTFLYCICEYLWKAVLDKRTVEAKYLKLIVETEDKNDIAEMIDNESCRKIFRSVFESLDRVSKRILKLYWEDLSPQQIADKLGYTNGYVRKVKCEAQAALVEGVKRHPEYKGIMNSEKVARGVVG